MACPIQNSNLKNLFSCNNRISPNSFQKRHCAFFRETQFMDGLGQCLNCKTLHLENLLKNVRNLPMHTRKYLLLYEEESVFHLTDCFVLF